MRNLKEVILVTPPEQEGAFRVTEDSLEMLADELALRLMPVLVRAMHGEASAIRAEVARQIEDVRVGNDLAVGVKAATTPRMH